MQDQPKPEDVPTVADAGSDTERCSFAERATDRQAVLAEFARMAFANMFDYVSKTPDGLVEVDLGKLDRDKAAAIDEVIVDYDGRTGERPQVKRVRFKLADKRAALVDLGRHLGLFSDRGQFDQKASDDNDADARQRITANFAEMLARGIDINSLIPAGFIVRTGKPPGEAN